MVEMAASAEEVEMSSMEVANLMLLLDLVEKLLVILFLKHFLVAVAVVATRTTVLTQLLAQMVEEWCF